MRAQVILRYVGFVLLFNATFLLISALFSLAGGDSALSPLLFSTVVCALFGLFPLVFVPATTDISNREGLFIVVCSWLASCLVGTLPYLLWGGGFSTKNASIAHFASPGMETTIILFMVLSGVHFGLLYQAVTGNPRDLFQSTVFRYYMIAILVGVVLVTINIHGPVYGQWVDALRYAAFQVVSIGTSTGFANADSSVWPPFAQLAILFFTLQCACSGSTSGGIKADRIVLLWKAAARRLVRLRHPKSVVVVKVNQAAVDDEVVETALTYILIYLGVLLVSTLAITGFGVDIMTAFSGAAAAMGNVGPGFGTVGSMGNYSHLPDLVKWILTADMLVGRLEIFGLILFVTIHRWR